MRAIHSEDMSREILAYLSEHPFAQDTLEGIVEWWLLQQKIQRWTSEVEASLAGLVSRGLVLKRKGLDQRCHYRLNPAELQAIREWLSQPESSSK